VPPTYPSPAGPAFDTIQNWRGPSRLVEYDHAWSILYHLGVGAGSLAAIDRRALDYVWEDRLLCLPTLASVIGGNDFFFNDPACGVSNTSTVHGAQRVETYRALRPADQLHASTWVEAVHDKGPGRGAIVDQVWEMRDHAGVLVARSLSAVFIKCAGGFGGTDSSRTSPNPPSARPSGEWALDTRPEQALVYRLVNDRSPLHVDPDFARDAGYRAPILHGLATLGCLALLLVVNELGNDPTRVSMLECRFTGPVFPGERLRLRTWHSERKRMQFLGLVDDRVVVDCGRVDLT
jgi:acyl dehydratase